MLASMMGQSEPGGGGGVGEGGAQAAAQGGLVWDVYMVEKGILYLAGDWEKGVIDDVIEEVDAPCDEAIVTLKTQQRDATTVWGKTREARKVERSVEVLQVLFRIRDCSRGRSVFPRHGHERLARVSCLRPRWRLIDFPQVPTKKKLNLYN